jgi:hypothetical protein
LGFQLRYAGAEAFDLGGGFGVEVLEAQRDRWKAIAEKRHAILLDLEWVVDAKDGDGSYCPYCMSMDDEVHVAGCKMAEAIAESARAANGGGE